MMAMFVTADGAVRFQQRRNPEHQVRVAIMSNFVNASATDIQSSIVTREYELYERTADLLVYREVVR